MPTEKKTLSGILQMPEAEELQKAIIRTSESPSLDRLDDPERALRFMRTNLRGSYTFGRFVVPSYATAIFASLTTIQPVQNKLGAVLETIIDVVKGELVTNNIFERPGEHHAHFWDALESYSFAGGDIGEVTSFLTYEGAYGFGQAIEWSSLWSAGSRRFAHNLLRCCEDPLALFILMPANEDLAPRLYARVLATFSREPQFVKFHRFLEKHVELDETGHGPAALAWLDMYIEKAGRRPAQIRAATNKVLAVFNPPVAEKREVE